jgi:hypothetical protein
MTQKIYKTARGKTVDIGSLRLQNEHVRAVGNMGVNARGDRIDSKGTVIDSRNNQLQRQIQRQTTNVSDGVVHTNMHEAKAPITVNRLNPDPMDFADEDDLVNPTAVNNTMATPVVDTVADMIVNTVPVAPEVNLDETSAGGLAAAIARAKNVKQELDKTPLQQIRSQGVRKI